MAVNGKSSSEIASFLGKSRSSLTEKESYDHALDRAWDVVQRHQVILEQELIEAPILANRLTALEPGQRQILLDNSGRFQTWGLLRLLLRRGEEETFSNPGRAEQILKTAFEISGRFHSDYIAEGIVNDMRARIWGYIANARRAQRELEASEDAFRDAFAYLERGTRDPMERATLWNLQASLLRTQERFKESLHILRRARRIFRRFGETQRVGSSLVNSAVAHRFQDELGTAITLLYRALELINPAHEPRLALIALHNLADDLSTAGRFLEARQVLKRAHRLYQQFPQSSIQTRRRWVEAKVAFGLGQPGAEALLEKAHQGFISSNKLYDMGLILQDLASLKAICGRP